MATKTKKTAPAKPAPARKGGRPEGAAPERAPHSEAYEAALREYTAALDLMRKGDNARAMEQFRAVEAGSTNEPELADRARTWAALCARRMAPAAPTQ